MLSRLLKRVHTPIFGFLLIFSDLFSILIVLVHDIPYYIEITGKIKISNDRVTMTNVVTSWPIENTSCTKNVGGSVLKGEGMLHAWL